MTTSLLHPAIGWMMNRIQISPQTIKPFNNTLPTLIKMILKISNNKQEVISRKSMNRIYQNTSIMEIDNSIIGKQSNKILLSHRLPTINKLRLNLNKSILNHHRSGILWKMNLIYLELPLIITQLILAILLTCLTQRKLPIKTK